LRESNERKGAGRHPHLYPPLAGLPSPIEGEGEVWLTKEKQLVRMLPHCHPGEGRDPEDLGKDWIPASAGMTENGFSCIVIRFKS